MATITGTFNSLVSGTLSGTIGTPGPQGIPGQQGPAGSQGPAGTGVPAGGSTGTYLVKASGDDFDTEWASINLTGYALESWVTTYFYPRTGNPDDFATQAWVQGQNYLTASSLSAYATMAWVNNELTPYATQAYVNSLGFITASALTPYATKASPTLTGTVTVPTPATSSNTTVAASTAFVKAQGYLTTSSAASDYAVIAAGQPISGTVGQVLTKNSGTNYDSSWTTLVQGDRYLTTSTTSNSIANGAKTFTVGTGLSYTTQQDVTIAYDATHHMHAVVTSYNSGTGVLVVDVQQHTGTGTYTAWTVNVGGTVPAQSVTWGDIVGTLGDQSDLASALNAKLASVDAASTYTTFGYTASTYFPIAGGALSLNSNITVADTSNSDSEMAGFGFGVQMSNDHTKGTTVEFDGLDTYDGASHMQVNPTGLVFPDTSVQTTSATNLGYISQGTADGLYYSISNPNGFTSNSFNSTDAIQAVSNNYASSVSNNPSTGNYLKYNGMNLVWDTPGGGGGGTTWGTITGNLYDQTDLQGVLDSKYSTSNPSGFTNFSSSDAISAITGGYTSSIAGGATISGQVLTYNGSQIYWNAGFSAPSSSNSVWAYGNWYSANVTGIYDGYMNYYTVLTF